MPFTPPAAGPFSELDPTLQANLEEMAAMRVSGRQAALLANVEENGRRGLSHVAAVEYFNKLPANLLADSAEGEAARRAHGVVTLRRYHASPFADQPNAAMGYVVPAPPNGVVLLIHDSAAEANVTVPGDPLPRVAFAELIVSAFAAYPTLKNCYFAAWARWIRDRDPAQRIIQASQIFSVTIWNGETAVDLHTTSGTLITEIEGNFAADERKAIRKRTTVGVLNGLIPGYKKDVPSWPYAYSLLPLGYDLARSESGKFVTITDGKSKWRPVRVAGSSEVEAVREMLRLFAAGKSAAECAAPLVQAGVRCRGQKHKANSTYRDLSKKQRERAVTNMIHEQNLVLWTTGTYSREKAVPIPTDGTLDGYPVIPAHGSFGHIKIHTPLERPEGGFLDEATADAIRRRLSRRGTKEGYSRENCALLAYLAPYQDEEGPKFTWQRRIKRIADNYVLLERPAGACLDDVGRPRGWEAGEGKKLLVVNREQLEAQIAKALQERLVSIADQLLPLQLVAARPTDATVALRERLAERETQHAMLVSDAEAADALARECVAPGPDQDLAAAARHSRHASNQHAAAERSRASMLQHLRDELANMLREPRREEIADLDARQPASLAGYMFGYAGHQVPTSINQLLRRHGADTLRFESDTNNSRRVRWSMTFTFPISDGTPAEISLEGTLRNLRRDQDQIKTEQEVDTAIAEDFLRLALPLDAIIGTYGPNRAAIVKRLRRWLERRGVTRRGLRSAIVDLPPDFAETRAVLWSCLTGQRELPDSLVPLRRHIASTYLSDQLHPNTYVREDCGLVRRVLNLMRDGLPVSCERGVDIGDLAKATGASETQINRLCVTAREAAAFSRRGILVRDPHNYRIVRLRPCPHEDCDAAPTYRYLAHYLPVPEIKAYAGLVCTACGRLPDVALADLVLPAAYLDTMWEGPGDPGNTDLCLGPATTAADLSTYATRSRLSRSARQYSIAEASRVLGVSDWAIRSWILDEHDPLPAVQSKGRGGSRYLISQTTLDALEGDPRLERIRQTCARKPEEVLELRGLLPLAELAHRTGVAEHFLRDRVNNGSLVPATRATGQAGRARMLFQPDVAEPADVATSDRPLTRDWVQRHQASHLSIGDAAARAGVSRVDMRRILDEGETTAYRTDGGTRLVDAADFTTWLTDRTAHGTWASPKEASQISGYTSEQLRAAAGRGDLTFRVTTGGHRRYRSNEVRGLNR